MLADVRPSRFNQAEVFYHETGKYSSHWLGNINIRLATEKLEWLSIDIILLLSYKFNMFMRFALDMTPFPVFFFGLSHSVSARYIHHDQPSFWIVLMCATNNANVDNEELQMMRSDATITFLIFLLTPVYLIPLT
jgi:hypothetical protein